MKRLVPSMFAFFVAICFSTTVGCAKKDPDKEKYEIEASELKLEKGDKDGKVKGNVKATLKFGKSITEAKSDADAKFKATFDGKSVTLTATDEAKDEDATVKVTIKGKNDKDEAKEVVWTVTVKKVAAAK